MSVQDTLYEAISDLRVKIAVAEEEAVTTEEVMRDLYDALDLMEAADAILLQYLTT